MGKHTTSIRGECNTICYTSLHTKWMKVPQCQMNKYNIIIRIPYLTKSMKAQPPLHMNNKMSLKIPAHKMEKS